MSAPTTTAPAYQFNRKAYINKECSHQQYNAQFVTRAVLSVVKRCIGLEAILASTDEHLNDIPLRRWDMLTWADDSRRMVAESNASMYASDKQHLRAVSESDKVSVMKAAARMLKDNPMI